MSTRFFKGIATGAIIGTAAGMLIYPQMDRSTRNKVKRSSKMVKNAAEDVFGEMKHWSK